MEWIDMTDEQRKNLCLNYFIINSLYKSQNNGSKQGIWKEIYNTSKRTYYKWGADGNPENVDSMPESKINYATRETKIEYKIFKGASTFNMDGVLSQDWETKIISPDKMGKEFVVHELEKFYFSDKKCEDINLKNYISFLRRDEQKDDIQKMMKALESLRKKDWENAELLCLDLKWCHKTLNRQSEIVKVIYQYHTLDNT
jgi:hypothetical protein